MGISIRSLYRHLWEIAALSVDRSETWSSHSLGALRDTPCFFLRSRLLLQSDFGQTAAMQLRGTQVLHAQVRIKNDTCTGTFTLRENIAAEQDILLE